MLRKFIDFLDWPSVLAIRATILIFSSIALLCFAIGALAQTEREEIIREVATENRFVKLEDAVSSLQEDLRDMKHYNLIQIASLMGLLGETGVRIIRRKP